jgi:lipoyl(octanoyl) transferase
MQAIFKDLDLIEYKTAWDYQENLLNENIEAKKQSNATQNTLIFCEHPHVFTLGKSGTVNNLLINDAFLSKINASYFKTNRGGDITYHGPGQIVGYPIFDLENFKIGIKEYVHLLEEAIIQVLLDYGITSSRYEGGTGVWIDIDKTGQARKICAIGVKASKFITMHGFALNVNTNLEYFNYINPCGFTDKGVTSMQKELGALQDFEKVKVQLKEKMAQVFNINYN